MLSRAFVHLTLVRTSVLQKQDMCHSLLRTAANVGRGLSLRRYFFFYSRNLSTAQSVRREGRQQAYHNLTTQFSIVKGM